MYSRETMTIDLAADLTSRCSEVDYDWRSPVATRYKAVKWCNEMGKHLVGYGPTALDAVIAVHNTLDQIIAEQENAEENEDE
jgi:hypothetical protein